MKALGLVFIAAGALNLLFKLKLTRDTADAENALLDGALITPALVVGGLYLRHRGLRHMWPDAWYIGTAVAVALVATGLIKLAERLGRR